MSEHTNERTETHARDLIYRQDFRVAIRTARTAVDSVQ